MFGKTLSFATIGIDAVQISIEADTKAGLMKFTVVGMPSSSVKESKDRVSGAIRNSGLRFPNYQYTVNLAPADLRKDGAALDLAISIAILKATQQINANQLDQYGIVGELSLDGSVRPVNGVLPFAVAAKRDKLAGLLVPFENASEAAIIKDLPVYPVHSLNEAVGFLEGKINIEPTITDPKEVFESLNQSPVDMSDVKGQMQVKRAMEVAAAGGHNLLMIGPPGSGKTMLARRLSTILPDITLEEALETTMIHSVAGLTSQFKHGITTCRPFRSPHHTISDIALIGGGAYPRPGEVSLSHNGVLFLDELPEFKKNALEVLRQPLEDGIVNISRAAQSLCFPAEFMLIASMNPCPCGYFGSNIPGHVCNCPDSIVSKYRSRVSGPLLDRIDIHVEVPAVQFQDLNAQPTGETSAVIRARVNQTRLIQQERFKKEGIFCNAQMNPKLIRKYCKLTPESVEILRHAIDKMGYSARVYDRILKLARTIADLVRDADIRTEHVSEAVQYRTLDRKYW